MDSVTLAAELQALRRGSGVRDPAVLERIGPQLKVLCGISAEDDARAARRRIEDTMAELLRDERREYRIALMAALALHPEARHQFLADRQRWLAGTLHVAERTARRRVEQATLLVAQRASEAYDLGEAGPRLEGWRVRSVRAFLRLDGPSPVLTEDRVIVVVQDGVDTLSTRFSLPHPHPHPRADTGDSNDLDAEVMYGGRIRACERLSAEHFRVVIALPRRYREGEVHEYGIRFRIPPGQAMAPHYALVPLVPVHSLDLTIRFDLGRQPDRLWRLDGVAPRMIDHTPADTLKDLRLDRFGEVRLGFRNLRQGFGYGAKWSSRPPLANG